MRTPGYKRPESVLVVVKTPNEVLLLRRRDDPTFWQSVTGSMLEQEHAPIETAIRELQEETGLTQDQGKLIDCHYSAWFEIYPHWRYRYPEGVTRNLEHVFVFEMADKHPIALSKEHEEYIWLSKHLAIEKVKSETNKLAIARFPEC